MANIKKVGVLGSGVMGRGIAAHVASAGCMVELLDIVLDGKPHNFLAENALEELKKSKPALAMHPTFIKKIRPGNLRDDLERLKDCDWVIEVVKEDLTVKQALYARIEPYLKANAWITSNTSGIPLRLLVEGRNAHFKSHFAITHFFNPVRYLRLLELIKSPDTNNQDLADFSHWLETALGKEVVPALDSPTFIANRIGVHGIMSILHYALKHKIPFEVIDSVLGEAAARSRSASFRTSDIAGLDVMAATAKNIYDFFPNDEDRDTLKFPELLDWMLSNKLLGNKTKQGFFKKDKGPDGKKRFLSLDPETKTYRLQVKKDWPLLKELKSIDDPTERVRTLLTSPEDAGHLAWECVAPNLIYAANRLGEVTEMPWDIDRAIKNGFNFELGPFELWDALGIKWVVSRLRYEGRKIPTLIENMLAKDIPSFYQWDQGVPVAQIHPVTLHYQPINIPNEQIELRRSKGTSKIIAENQGARLIDLGDDVACLEFKTKMNAIDDQIVFMMEDAIQKYIPGRFKGLVVGNQGKMFSAGANLVFVLNAARDKNYDLIEQACKRLQDACRLMTYAPFPVVAAPFQMVLGGGCEVTMACQRVVGQAETYMGLVEVGVGVIPAGGGCLQMLLRLEDALNTRGERGPMPKVKAAFQLIGTAHVNTSFDEAQRLGYFRRSDRRVMNSQHLLYEAKKEVLSMVPSFKPIVPRVLRLPGLGGVTALISAVKDFRLQGLASDHDVLIMKELAYILSGGDVSPVQDVTEERILELERQAFARLCGYEKTQARMESILTKGKPLRN